MILLDCKQGGTEWHQARLGIVTASCLEKIITPKTRKGSSQQDSYAYQLLSEWALGVPANMDASQFMDRGTQLEPLARKWYAYDRGVEVREVGLVLRDDRMVGASPDGLVGDDGGLEIKCPSAANHLRNLLEGMDGYFCQVQGALWLTGRKWWDLMSYNPELPPVVKRHERDEEFIAAMEEEVDNFITRLLLKRDTLMACGVKKAERLLIPATAVAEETPF